MGEWKPYLSLTLGAAYNDSLLGMRSVMDAMERRGGVLSSFRESANKISASVFTTRAGAAENPRGTSGLNRQATTPKAATQRYSHREAAWNMTTVAAAGIRISSAAWYPRAKRPGKAGSTRPASSAALAIHFMNVVSIESSFCSRPIGKRSGRLSSKSARMIPSTAPAPRFARPGPLSHSCHQQPNPRHEQQRHGDKKIYFCRVHQA